MQTRPARSRLAMTGALAGALALLLGLLAACGGGPDPTATPRPTATPVTQPGQPTPTPAVGQQPTEDLTARAEAYFRGKTIRMVVGFTPGGGHDVVARVLGGHMPQYIPGEPRFIIQNLPGAGSTVAAENVYTSRGDGLTWAVTANQLVDGALGKEFAHFDALRTRVLGIVYDNASNRPFTGVLRSAGGSFEEILNTRGNNPVRFGALRDIPGGMWQYMIETYDLPFRVVPGYGGTSAALQAMVQGEIEGTDVFFSTTILGLGMNELATSENVALIIDPYCNMWPRLEDWLEHGGWQRPPCWQDVLPLTDLELQVMDLFEAISTQSTYVIHGPPDVEEWVVQVLRDALQATAEDPAFQQDMRARDAFPGYISGEEVERNTRELSEAPQEVRDILERARGV